MLLIDPAKKPLCKRRGLRKCGQEKHTRNRKDTVQHTVTDVARDHILRPASAEVGDGTEHADRAEAHEPHERDLGPWRVVFVSAKLHREHRELWEGGQLTPKLAHLEVGESFADVGEASHCCLCCWCEYRLGQPSWPLISFVTSAQFVPKILGVGDRGVRARWWSWNAHPAPSRRARRRHPAPSTDPNDTALPLAPPVPFVPCLISARRMLVERRNSRVQVRCPMSCSATDCVPIVFLVPFPRSTFLPFEDRRKRRIG